jgi:hypothetical protein
MQADDLNSLMEQTLASIASALPAELR